MSAMGGYRIRRHKGILASVDASKVSFLFSRQSVRVEDIREAHIEQGYWSKQIVLHLVSGERVSVSAPYISEDRHVLNSRLGIARPPHAA